MALSKADPAHEMPPLVDNSFQQVWCYTKA
jgi:hypothetical protein